jgi:hypothetical protein
MATYYIRVEAVNLGQSIYDTNDLSTIRGGGLRALECATAIGPKFELEEIYTGASQGLFEFDATGEREANEKKKAVLEYLLAEYPEQIITVEMQAAGSNFQADVRLLAAKSGWSQMQSPTLVFPGNGNDVCHFDRIRPANWRDFRKGAAYVGEGLSPKVPISDHTMIRRNHGIGTKHHQFYDPYLPSEGERKSLEIDFVNDFDQLSDYPDAKRLHHKIAVVYLDGNRFGTIFRGLEKLDDYKEFSSQLKKNGEKFLEQVLRHIDNSVPATPQKSAWHWEGAVLTNDGASMKKDYAIRLETLLWGGDEIIWVAPAWQGWWLLENFFWNWGKEKWDDTKPDPRRTGSQDSLRWGGAMVFCHHDAPIHDITSLAHDLADQPKENPHENRFTYQVLESFDSLGKQATDLRKRKLPEALRPNAAELLVLPGNGMAKIREGIQKLRIKLPRGRVHEIVANLCRSNGNQLDLALATQVLEKAEAKADFATLQEQIYGAPPTAAVEAAAAATWIHLNELWDYIPQEGEA